MEIPQNIQCPWCGEVFVTFIDLSIGDQSYIEDCQVCCRPIELFIAADPLDGSAVVTTQRS